MIPFDQITEELLLKRADELPESITDALYDPATNKIVTDICESFGIKEEDKLLVIRQLVAFVLLGFIRDYDLWSEIDDALSLKSPSLAREIAIGIGNNLFAPIKEDLAKNYKPLLGTPANTEKLIQFAVDKRDSKPEPIKDVFERISATSGTIPGKLPTLQSMSASASPSLTTNNQSPTPTGPVFLHKESLFEPIKTKTDFRLQFPGQKPLAPSSSQPQRTGPAFRIDLKPKTQELKPSLNTPPSVPASSFAQNTAAAKPFTQDIRSAVVTPKNAPTLVPQKPVNTAPMPPTPIKSPAPMPIPTTTPKSALTSIIPKLQIPTPSVSKIPSPMTPKPAATAIPTPSIIQHPAPTPPRSFEAKIQDKMNLGKIPAPLVVPNEQNKSIPVPPQFQAPLPPAPPRPAA